MRVVVCIPCLLVGGTEVQTLNLVKALIEGGHQVGVACYFEHVPEMVKQYEDAGASVELFSPEGTRYAGVKCIKHLWRGLRLMIKTYKPDVVHVQYMAPGAIPIVLLRMMGVTNIIATAHTMADIYTPNGLRLVRFIQQHLVRAFTCITMAAEKSFFGCSQMYQPGMTLGKRNHFTIYNSLPSNISVRKSPRNFNSDVITIGVVSRLETIKGMDLVVPAFQAALTKIGKNADLKLLVVGDGSLSDTMKQQAADLGVSDRVDFVGRINADEIQSYYDQIDILLMPSRSEGFGLTSLEAMARGCVVIASDIGGLPEVIEDGVSGFIIESDNFIASTSRAISYLTQNPTHKSSISNNAINRANFFGVSTFKNRFLGLYKSL